MPKAQPVLAIQNFEFGTLPWHLVIRVKLGTCVVYITDSSKNTFFSIINIHLGTHGNELWDLKAKFGLFGTF